MVLLKVTLSFTFCSKLSFSIQGCRTIYLRWSLYKVIRVIFSPCQYYLGKNSRLLPDFPHLDSEYDQVTLIAFPMSVENRDRDIVWLLCEDMDDLK